MLPGVYTGRILEKQSYYSDKEIFEGTKMRKGKQEKKTTKKKTKALQNTVIILRL